MGTLVVGTHEACPYERCGFNIDGINAGDYALGDTRIARINRKNVCHEAR